MRRHRNQKHLLLQQLWLPVWLGLFLLVPTSGADVLPAEHPPAAPPSTATTVTHIKDVSLQALSDKAKAAFRARMNPPITEMTIPQIAVRDSYTPLRNYLIASYEDAIDALLEEAATSGRVAIVRQALRELVHRRSSTTADTVLAQVLERKKSKVANREIAAAMRHTVALTELPAALAAHVKPPFEPMPFQPLGQKALPALRAAAELDPTHSWTWLVIALMSGPQDLDDILCMRNAQTAASGSGDRAAAMSSSLFYGQFREVRGELSQARDAYAWAVALARSESGIGPDMVIWRQELARSLVMLGQVQAKEHDTPGALASLQEALKIREALAANDTSNMQAGLEVIASYVVMAHCYASLGLEADAASYYRVAFARYHDIASRDAYSPMLEVTEATLAIVLVAAGTMSLLFGAVGVSAYNRRVASLMKAAADASLPDPAAPSVFLVPPRDKGKLSLRLQNSHVPHKKVYDHESMNGARKASRRASWTYAAAGLAFATAAALLVLVIAEKEVFLNRVMVMTWAIAWPVVLTLALLWGPDRRRAMSAIAVYFIVLLSICWRVATSSSSEPLTIDQMGFKITLAPFFLPLFLWGMYSYPFIYLLAFLNRRIRAIGPALLIFMLCLALGAMAAEVVRSMYAVTKALGDLCAFLGVPAETVFVLVPVAGMILSVPPAWMLVRKISGLYAAKCFSNETMILDSIWLFHTVLLMNEMFYWGAASGWIGLALFGIYKVLTLIGLRPLAKEAVKRRPVRLLLLRTFGFRRRAELLFDLLGARWRYAGPILLVAAPDLATRALDPGKFLRFLTGRLRRSFLIEPSDLPQHMAQLDQQPDPDGRYRVNELFCGQDAWQPAVIALMGQSDLVAMDLRGFTQEHEGCVFELQSLINLVGVGRVVLLIDKKTDEAFLHQTLNECWEAMDAASPNWGTWESLTLLKVSSNASAVSTLFGIADDALTKAVKAVSAGNQSVSSRSYQLA